MVGPHAASWCLLCLAAVSGVWAQPGNGAAVPARPDMELRTKGKQLYRAEDYTAAAAAFEAAVAAVPTDADNHAYLANTLFRLG